MWQVSRFFVFPFAHRDQRKFHIFKIFYSVFFLFIPLMYLILFYLKLNLNPIYYDHEHNLYEWIIIVQEAKCKRMSVYCAQLILHLLTVFVSRKTSKESVYRKLVNMHPTLAIWLFHFILIIIQIVLKGINSTERIFVSVTKHILKW